MKCGATLKMKTYNTFVFTSQPEWDKVPVASIDSFHWEKEIFVRPRSYAKLCAVEGKGLYARLWSFEKDVRAVFENRDEPVYRDSCLEFFMCPFENSAVPYINFEMNSKGVILSEYGAGRGKERTRLISLSEEAPEVSVFTVNENGETAWGVSLFVSEKLMSDITKTDFKIKPMTLRGNFYKCGDDTPIPHFGAFSPVGPVENGFHNPEMFGELVFNYPCED